VTMPMANVFGQKTRMMPEGTNAVHQQEVKTEVLPGLISQETRVNSSAALAATTDSPRRGQGIGFLAGIGAVVLLGGVAAAGVYFVKPSLFSGNSSAQQPSLPIVSADQPPMSNVGLAGANANASAAAVTSPESGQTARTTETAKGGKKATDTKSDSSTSSSGETVVQVPAAEGDLPPGGMVVTKKNPDGTTTTTRLVPRTPVPGDKFNPFPPGFDPGMYQFMTPAQRQQVRDAMKKARETQKMAQPGPRPRRQPQQQPQATPENKN
jgi:hypothetical protein